MQTFLQIERSPATILERFVRTSKMDKVEVDAVFIFYRVDMHVLRACTCVHIPALLYGKSRKSLSSRCTWYWVT